MVQLFVNIVEKPSMLNASPPPLRIFFAIDLPNGVKNKIGELIEQLKLHHTHHSIRWTKPSHLHLTLQFIGAIKPEDIDKLIENVRKALHLFPRFDLQIGALELFPTPYKPKIISLAIGPHDIHTALAKAIGVGIAATGYDVESRPFRGHITLARIKTNKPIDINAFKTPEFDTIPINEIVLYKSEPSSAGSSYTVLKKIILHL